MKQHIKRFVLLWLIVANVFAWICNVPQHNLGLIVGCVVGLILTVGIIGITWSMTE
jgi:hypothetical protein